MVAAALGAQVDVVQIEKGGVPATGNAAALMIAPQYSSANRRRDALLCASAHVCALSIAVEYGNAARCVVCRLDIDTS